MSAQHPDIQAVSDANADIYEAIATLEYHGRRVGAAAIIAATRLPESDVTASLATLVAQGLLTTEDSDGELVYVPAHRGWSAVPDQAEGKGLG